MKCRLIVPIVLLGLVGCRPVIQMPLTIPGLSELKPVHESFTEMTKNVYFNPPMTAEAYAAKLRPALLVEGWREQPTKPDYVFVNEVDAGQYEKFEIKITSGQTVLDDGSLKVTTGGTLVTLWCVDVTPD